MKWRDGFVGGNPAENKWTERVAMPLTLVDKFAITSNSNWCLRFSDTVGHCVVWFSRAKDVNIEVGATVNAVFTVKGHHRYKGVDETTIKGFQVTSS